MVELMNKFYIKKIGHEELDSIEDMWKLLRFYIKNLTPDFKYQFHNMSFDARKAELIAKAKDGKLRIDLAIDTEKNQLGYCISTINNENIGEIDSIFVKEEYRSQGIGKQLLEKALNWMDMKGVKTKKIFVTVGNTEVISFYENYGFKARSLVLEQVNNEGGSS